MRTYTHALLTFAATRRLGPRAAAWAALGASVPDLPVGIGAAWLWARRRTLTRETFDREVCGRILFRRPDAALHSALPVAAAFAFHTASGSRARNVGRARLALLLGWAGHVAADALTHGGDARPLLWPLSGRRFSSPVSYWENDRYGQLFKVVEHAAVLAAVVYLFSRR